MRARRFVTFLAALAATPLAAGSAASPLVLVEAEGFADTGGWSVDPQFMDIMGSPYLLAHGLGVPVADAKTKVAVPAAGTYRVFVRTMDWVARWRAPGSPGRFEVRIDGRPLPAIFGTEGAEWHWQAGGTVTLERSEIEIALHDLTGFEGRCDAILLSADPSFVPPDGGPSLALLRRKLLAIPESPEDAWSFDLVVVGGGVAGTCAAVSAARHGVRVALVQNRPVLGGNSSSEVRVWIQGATMIPPFPRLGRIVRELGPVPTECPSADDVARALDARKLEVVRAERNISLFLQTHVFAVQKEGDRIAAVIGREVRTGRESRFRGRWFLDATGDGTVGALAGADVEILLEGHMGPTNLWRVADAGAPSPFPRCPWALDLRDKPFPQELERLGKWFWESGFWKHPIDAMEEIRDWNLRAMYGAWDALKNAKGLYPNHKLQWAAYIAGKRESRRILGDIVLRKEDILEGRSFPDGCVPATWPIDLHLPNPRYAKGFEGEEFISQAHFTAYRKPYLIPYRCLYARTIPNLFLAGRDISVTHEALGAVRVMGTGGMMGEVVGMAASLCKEHACDPRDIYERHLEELLSRIRGSDPEAPLFPESFGPNLARGARVTTSGDRDPASPGSNVCDGRFDISSNEGRWLSEAKVPNWVELAWDSPRTIAGARILSGYFDGLDVRAPIEDFVLQAFEGGAWRDIPGTATAGNGKTDWSCTFAPVAAQRIRLLVRRTPQDISRIWEIGFHGPLR